MIRELAVRLEKTNLHIKRLRHIAQKGPDRVHHICCPPTLYPHMIIANLLRLLGHVLYPKQTTVIAVWPERMQNVLRDVDK